MGFEWDFRDVFGLLLKVSLKPQFSGCIGIACLRVLSLGWQRGRHKGVLKAWEPTGK